MANVLITLVIHYVLETFMLFLFVYLCFFRSTSFGTVPKTLQFSCSTKQRFLYI